MFTINIAQECGCFKKSDLKNNMSFDNKDDALIKAKKNVDFFLKIEGDFTRTQKTEIIKKINNIAGVLACAELVPDKLKEINNLIY